MQGVVDRIYPCDVLLVSEAVVCSTCKCTVSLTALTGTRILAPLAVSRSTCGCAVDVLHESLCKCKESLTAFTFFCRNIFLHVMCSRVAADLHICMHHVVISMCNDSDSEECK